ncbi:MAG: polyhydroxyalkanoic acid system family protein [Burkholderiaceae bacterium]|nr:polyhydroxyalkanoic acid system family protein [Burkholderiaceae bacterium]
MTTFHIHRSHNLGLAGARSLVRHWAEAAERKHQMSCNMRETESGDQVDFKRSGVHGELAAGAETFDLTVTLGFLLSAFSQRIRDEIERNLDSAIAQASAAAGSGSGDLPGG